MPIMTAADLMASAASELDQSRVVTAMHDVVISRWITLDRRKSFRVLAEGQRNNEGVHVSAARIEMATRSDSAGQEWENVATCSIETRDAYPEPPDPFPPLPNARQVTPIYETLEGFHGPAFHLMRSVLHGDMGASSTLDVTGARRTDPSSASRQRLPLSAFAECP
jgi:hypothetical protein